MAGEILVYDKAKCIMLHMNGNRNFSNFTIIAIIATSDLTIIGILATSDLTIIGILATPPPPH